MIEMTDVRPAPGPWAPRHTPNRCVRNGRGDQEIWCVDWSDDQEEVCEIVHGEANARLITAACNSYQQHCADPVAAAESDLLGEALMALEALRDAVMDSLATQTLAAHMDSAAEQARALLAKAEGKA